MLRILRRPPSADLTIWSAPPLASDSTKEDRPTPEDVLAAARQAAEEELARARLQAEEERARAREQGYAEGRARADEELQERVRALEELTELVNQRQETFLARMEQEAVALALAVASKVVDHTVEAHPELVIAQVRRCLRRVTERERIRVRVNPADVETLRQAKEGLTAAFDGVQRLDIIEDYRVGRGGCTVESESGILDARLDRQLEEVARSLSEVVEVVRDGGEV